MAHETPGDPRARGLPSPVCTGRSGGQSRSEEMVKDGGGCPAQHRYARWFAITNVHRLLAAFPTLTRVDCCPSAASAGSRTRVGDVPRGSAAVSTCFTGLGPALRAAAGRSPGHRPHPPDRVSQSSHEHRRVGRWTVGTGADQTLSRPRGGDQLAGRWALEVVEVWCDPDSPLQAALWCLLTAVASAAGPGPPWAGVAVRDPAGRATGR